ncbi:6-bladed beta-propeller [Pseudomonadota bacterium]
MSLRKVSLLCMLLVFAGGMLTGCAQIPTKFRYHPGQALPDEISQEMVWPSSPDQARYRYVGQLTGEDNFYSPGEKTANAGLRFLKWLVGLTGHSPNPTVLQRPQAVMVADDGRVFVSDVSRQAVYVFDKANGSLDVWEMVNEELKFELPIGLAQAKNGDLLVADASLKVVVRLDSMGKPAGLIGLGQLTHPAGIAVNPDDGLIYVADRGENQIKVFDDSGTLLFRVGEFGEELGQLNGPTYLFWHETQLYVTDTLNSRIQIFSPTGEFVSTFGRRGLYLGDLPRPKGVAVDNAGNVYVVESYYDYLLVFNREGELLLPVGGSGYEIGQFYLPAGVWADNKNYIYVADTFNGRVVIFEYLGDVDGPSHEESGAAADGVAAVQ